jgi:hypothetical protein
LTVSIETKGGFYLKPYLSLLCFAVRYASIMAQTAI